MSINFRNAALPLRSVAGLALVLAVSVGACGGSDTDSDAAPTTDIDADNGGTSGDGDALDDAESTPSGGGGAATLTMSDGTTFDLELQTCETHDTEPDIIPLIGGYNLESTSADGYRFDVARLGMTAEDVAIEFGALEANDGEDNEVLYTIDNDSLTLVAEGNTISGTFLLGAITPNRPFGDQIDATFSATC